MHIHRLTARSIPALLRKAGRHRDGRGLVLEVATVGRAAWSLIYVSPVAGKRRQLGLGRYPDVSLAEARKKADASRQLVRDGVDPINRKVASAMRSVPTFAKVAEAFIASKSSGWKSGMLRAQQWRRSLDQHAAALQALPIDQVDRVAVLDALRGIWASSPVMSATLRSRVAQILDYAAAHGHRSGENPAALKSLQHLLPAQPKRTIEHYAALAADDLPALMKALDATAGPVASLLRFTILTCARSAEARGARWDEIDLAAGTWIVPAARMKKGKSWRVPLSKAAREILHSQSHNGDGLVFPSAITGGLIAQSALIGMLRRLGCERATTHGMRACFSTWCHDRGVRYELIEESLAHDIGSSVERAYARGDRLRDRAVLMEMWSAFATGELDNVVDLQRKTA